MAHPQQLAFIRTACEHLASSFAGKRVLEIGSYDVNGSIRPFFGGSDYVGVDLTAGPGVDVVCAGENVDHPDDSYDLTVSCECFEHNPEWQATFMNMVRMTRPGGIVMFTSASKGRLEHGTVRNAPQVSPGTSLTGPLQGWYYYRNLTERDFRAHIDFEALFAASFFLFNPYSRDLYFAGQKRCGQPVFHFDAPVLRLRCHEELEVNQRLVGAKRGFKPLSLLAEAPLRIAMYLPDRHFQNFAVPYSRFVNRIRALRRDALRKNP